MFALCNSFSGTSFELILGANSVNSPESGSSILTSRTSIRHADYNENTINNDIAVIQLPSAVSFSSECYSTLINIRLLS